MNRLMLALVSLFSLPVLASEVPSYSRDVQPIFNAKCVACHACYDAPCQLNLASGEGAQRGASQLPVYSGSRTVAQATTRLYLDAHDEAAWRRKGFASVLQPQQQSAALMARMLDLGHNNPWPANSKLPATMDIDISRQNQCPLPEEFADFARKNPRAGMPFAVTGLDAREYDTLQRWLAAGAPVDEQLRVANASEAAQISQWEALLNGDSPREVLVARWLYEHLFLAHLYFDQGQSGQFFQVVRSRTPSGQPIDPIATRRPNDDPGTRFFYRLWPIQGAIVHKTHITYPLSAKKLARVQELFFTGDWSVEALPGYSAQRRANPFETFAAIPAQARYQFMLDNAEYFVRTFIRGPVCRGQIATDVIRDQFWALFQSPEHDLYLTDPQFRAAATPLLALPGQVDELRSLPRQWSEYKERRNHYEALRRDTYAEAPPPSWSHIWAGNDNALLSIFRQFDSASVRKGLIGAIPQTLWLLDYPLLERTYYGLVVNFDVFGNVSHQAQTRLYFDLIRNGAEVNFLRLMPADSREPLLENWYAKSGRLKLWLDYQSIDASTPTALQLDEARPKEDFAERLIQRYATLNARPDPINRCQGAHCYRPNVAVELQRAEQSLSRLTNRPAAGLKVIEQLPEASMLSIDYGAGQNEVYTLLRNRAHSNVAFMVGEELRYEEGLDTLTVYPGVLSSYPNFMFSLKADEVAEFVTALEQARSPQAFDAVVQRWGIRRTHPQFWAHFDKLNAYIERTEPVESGILDINRYKNL